MRPRWIVWLVLLFRQFPTQIDATRDATIDIPPSPSSVKMYNVNGNPFMNWTYPDYNKDRRVTFQVVAKDSWEEEWITQCNKTEKHSCDIVSPIFSLGKKCALHSGEYAGRVRACVHAPNGTIKCSSWIVEMLDIPMADQFSAPDFEIDGVYYRTQLRISNRPFVVRHSNISLNCYYRRHLAYKILYWVGSDKNNSIQDGYASFELTTISLRLAFAPRRRTEICVQMAIIHEITEIRHQWKTQCIQYTPTPDESSKYAAIGVGIAVALLIFFIALRVFKLIRSNFSGEKFILPSDLNELINDVSIGQEDIERQTITEAAHMICLDLADEKYDSAVEIISTHDNVSMLHGSHISLIFQTLDFVESDPINHADSIPYIADAEAAAFLTSHGGNDGEIIDNEVLCSCIEDSGRYLTAIRQEDKNRILTTLLPDFPLTIEQLARARLCSSSMADLASNQRDFTIVERRSRSTDNIMKLELNEYCRTSESIESYQQEPVIFTAKLVGKCPAPREQTLASDATGSFSKGVPPTATTVCIENPTYNPNPGLFDFLDETFYCVANSSEENNGIADAMIFSKRTNSVENCASLLDRRVTSYGKRCHIRTREETFQSAKFFIPEEGKLDNRLHTSPDNLGLGCSSSSSPKKMRVASDADSGYHVENFSVSDGSSMSPPLSPDEKLYPDVFPRGISTHECHRCSNDSGHSLCPMLHNAKLHHHNLIEPLYSTNSLEGDDDSYVEESPYITEGNLKYIA